MPNNDQDAPMRWSRFHACPLCEGIKVDLLRNDSCITHPLWQPGLPTQMQWMHCKICEHVYSRDYLTDEGLTLLFKRANPEQVGGSTDLDRERFRWAPTVERVQRYMPLAPWLSDDSVWLDVGCGSGGLVITAAEYGFAAIGVDARQQAVDCLAEMGYSAVVGDLLSLSVSAPVAVLSLADVLEHVPYPRQALQRAHSAIQENGLLVISCPNLDSGSWRQNTALGNNPYWSEIEHCHNFSRSSLMRLLAQERYIPLEYSISSRYKSCMEIVARRA